jgi:hypothetical protein
MEGGELKGGKERRTEAEKKKGRKLERERGSFPCPPPPLLFNFFPPFPKSGRPLTPALFHILIYNIYPSPLFLPFHFLS